MSLQFLPITHDILARITPYISFTAQNGRLCDYTPGVLSMWRRRYRTAAAIDGDTLYLRLEDGGATYYATPQGENLSRALDRLEAHLGYTPDFCTVPEALLPYFLSRYPTATATDDRDWYDYLYDTESLATLAGRRYSGQRNHLKRFIRAYGEPDFVPLCRENAGDALAFLDRYERERQNLSQEARAEAESTRELLVQPDFFGQMGGILKASGRVFGFVIGEVVGDTVYDHVEKADANAEGAYQMLVNCFARAFRAVPYMNREEDCGVAGLRTSKLSYHPRALLKKYTVKQRGQS